MSKEMIDRRALQDDLTKTFAQYQYRLDHPMPSATESFETYRIAYQTDSLVHAKVDAMVAGVMSIVNKHASFN